MPPTRDTVTLPRAYAQQSLDAAKELGAALGANAEVVERAEAAILQARADREEFVQVLRDARDVVERATARLDAVPAHPPAHPEAPTTLWGVLGHMAATRHGAAVLSLLVAAVAADLFGLSILLGFDPSLVIPGGSP